MPLLCTDAITQKRAPALDPNGSITRVSPPAQRNRLRANLACLAVDVVFLYRLLRHPKTRWYAKGLLSLPVIYICSPIQLIPNFIPIAGQMDDLFVIWMTKKIALNLVDEKTWQECHGAAVATMLPFQSKRTRHVASPIGYLRPESQITSTSTPESEWNKLKHRRPVNS